MNAGSGLIGELATPVREEELLKQLKTKFGLTVIRHSPLTGKPVTRIALCGGAGSFLISNALHQNAELFYQLGYKIS